MPEIINKHLILVQNPNTYQPNMYGNYFSKRKSILSTDVKSISKLSK
jgi:hypothetical protein